MEKIVSFFLSIVTTVLTFFGINTAKPIVPQEQAESFEPTVRFFVCSDTHISSSEDFKLERIKKAVEFSYKTAENDKSYNNLDAVVFCGDLTDGGTEEQFEAFEKAVKSSVKGDTKILALVANQHDSYEHGKKSTEFCSKITGLDSDFNIKINGFHFIGLSTSKKENGNHNLSQKIWLKKQLSKAKKEDSRKPVFVFHHEHNKETVYGSSAFDGWGIKDFKNILKKYPQVVDFSGHSHYPLNDPRSIWQGQYTAVGTGSMNYMEFTVDNDRTVHTDDGWNAAQGWIIEADKDNRVRLRGFDVITGQWLCEYLIKNPSDVDSYAYTPYNQEALSSAPEFDEESVLKIEKSNDKYTVTAPQAKSTDGKIIFLYRVKVLNEEGLEVYSEYKLNNYWTANLYPSISFTVDAKPGYQIEITAENAYGMKSIPLSVNTRVVDNYGK